jgi:UDP-2,3-diacylglucosamine pyrophosphatase LpxH
MNKRRKQFEQALVAARGEWHARDYSARLLLTDTRIAIASDVHIPYHDEKLVARFLDECASHKIDAIVWLGDLLDMHTFSSWGRTDQTTQYKREIKMARTLIEMAAGVVPVQYWSRGNHEQRLFRKTDGQLDMEQLAGSIGLTWMLESGQLIVSDNPTLDADPDPFFGKPRWMLTHPAVYGSQPLVVPGKLAGRYEQNILSAHAHHWGMGVDPTGKYTVIETGGLFEPKYHEYVQYNVTTHRAWTKGFWFLIDGHPTGFRGEGN